MRRYLVLIASAALAVTWAVPARAASIVFSPNGTGSVGAVTIDAMNLNVSNALSEGINANSPVGTIGTLLFQANLSNGTLLGAPVFASCLTGNCFTVVASFTEIVTANTAGTLTFALDTAPGAQNYFYIYANATQQGDDLTGNCFVGSTGNNGGLGCNTKNLVLQGQFLADGSFAASFTHAPTSITPLDNFGVNNYPGINTIGGTGSFQGNVDTFTHVNPLYFPSGLPAGIFWSASSQNSLPFSQVNPSACFSQDGLNGGATTAFAGTATGCVNQAGVATVGTLNAVNGNNTMLQTHASVAFNAPAAVPEPATLTLLGFGLIGAGAARRRQRKNSAK